MARPQKQGMDYFPHDTDATGDEKIDRLRMLYGNDGYAFYFILLERIYRTADFELDVSDAETIQILARKVEVTAEKFAEMLQTALRSGCFCQDAYSQRGVLTSGGIKKRAEGVTSKRQKMAERYQQAPKPVSDAETQQKPDKVKESKVKESKRKKNSSAAAAALGASSSDQEPTITHKLRQVVESINPAYYWAAKDGTAAKDLAEKLRHSFRTTKQRDATDADLCESLRRLIIESRKLPTAFYHFKDVCALNQHYNAILLEIKSPTARSPTPSVRSEKANQPVTDAIPD